MLDKKPEQVYEQIEGILKINGAKGIRKCIRLDLEDTNDVNGYFSYKTFLYSFKLKDISSVGFVAITPAKMANIFQKDSFIHNVSITMGRYSFVCTINVYKTTILNGQCVVVALFADDTPKEIIKKVHNFVYATLEVRNRVLQESLPREYTDYSVRPAIAGSDKNEEGSVEGAENIGEVEELTEEESKNVDAAGETQKTDDKSVDADNQTASEDNQNAEQTQVKPADQTTEKPAE